MDTCNQAGKDEIEQLLRDLELVCSKWTCAEVKWTEIAKQIHSDEMSRLVLAISKGQTFVEAIHDEAKKQNSRIRHILFGSTPMESLDVDSGSLSACDNAHRMIVRFGCSKGLSSNSEKEVNGSDRRLITVIVDTNFQNFSFTLRTVAKADSAHFLQMDQPMAVTEIALVGSLWSSVFPQHAAILTRTIAFSAPRSTKSILFSERNALVNPWKDRLRRRSSYQREHQSFERLSAAFGTEQEHSRPRPMQLMTMEDIRVDLEGSGSGRAPVLLSETAKGEHVLRRYVPPYSQILRFGDNAEPRAPSRPDYVVTYKPDSTGREFHRDFLLSYYDWLPEDTELYRAAFDLLHMLAIRRSGLFRLGFAQRVYTVLLPPAVLQVEGRPDDGIFLVPCIILYQVPRKSTFRRTFTLSHIAVPISLEGAAKDKGGSGTHQAYQPRMTTIDELHALRADLKTPIIHDELAPKSPSVSVTGPLSQLIAFPKGSLSVPQVLQHVSRFVLSEVLSVAEPSTSAGVAASMAFASSLESRLATLLVQVKWNTPPGDCQPWERWLTTGTDTSLRDNVYKLMFYDDFLDPQSGYTSRRGVDLQTMLVGNNLRTDMNGMTFFDPTDELKLIVYPQIREHYPNYSIIRWMAFSLYAESALCSLQGMIQRFYLDLNEQEDLQRIVDTLEDMIESFAELYDLDIRLHLYRQEYEKLRQLLKVDRDYEFLVNKFTSVKEDASLREQRLFNKLLVAFTLSSASVAIVSTMAQVSKWTQWSLGKYLKITVLVAIVLTVGGYTLFDKARRFLSRRR